jgi:hypothetical protein
LTIGRNYASIKRECDKNNNGTIPEKTQATVPVDRLLIDVADPPSLPGRENANEFKRNGNEYM